MHQVVGLPRNRKASAAQFNHSKTNNRRYQLQLKLRQSDCMTKRLLNAFLMFSVFKFYFKMYSCLPYFFILFNLLKISDSDVIRICIANAFLVKSTFPVSCSYFLRGKDS